MAVAIIPGVKVDYTLSPRIITIPVPGVPVDVSIEDLQDTLQDIEDNEADGILYPRLRDCSGGEVLGGGRYVGYTMKLNNAQVMFEPQTVAQSEGTATADEPAGKILTDSSATFVADGVDRGSALINWTSRATSVVTEVLSETQLRHVVLSGGSRTTWLIGDDYRVYPIIKCSVGSGNLTAEDGVGAELDPIMSSPHVRSEKESATSAALVAGSGGVTAAECADAVWDEDATTHVLPGSMAQEVHDIGALCVTAVDGIDDLAIKVSDLHAEAFGRWVLNPTASTLTLYREDGSPMQVFNLTSTPAAVPAYVERNPA